jgi:hypothetical protein
MIIVAMCCLFSALCSSVEQDRTSRPRSVVFNKCETSLGRAAELQYNKHLCCSQRTKSVPNYFLPEHTRPKRYSSSVRQSAPSPIPEPRSTRCIITDSQPWYLVRLYL